MQQKYEGLSKKQVEESRVAHGPNVLEVSKPKSTVRIFFENILTPFGIVLIFAALLSFINTEYLETFVILFVIILNAVLGTYQEAKSERIIESLQNVLKHIVTVVRGAEKLDISASEVVVGDIVYIKPGSKIPADGKLLESNDLTISEAILTGESRPIQKAVSEEVYSGTIVTAGFGYLEVNHVGAATEFGKIAVSATSRKNEKSPLQSKFVSLSYQILIAISILIGIIVLSGLVAGVPLIELFEIATALAVSAIPEALTVSVTMALAISLNRLLKKNALIRKLVTAETLGSVTTICLDKTGTLTKGEMSVITQEFSDKELFYDALSINNKDFNAVDTALKQYLQDYKISKDYKVEKNIPFSSERKYSATITTEGSFFVGAPEKLLRGERSWKAKIEAHTENGSRVVGVGYSPKKIEAPDKSLSFIGFVVIEDPIRKDIPEHFAAIEKLGISIKVITGDLKLTALKIARDAGIDIEENRVLSGAELKRLSTEELAEKIQDITLFYRTTPDQKYRIVEALQASGAYIAMMGDGVNDAPALRKADIGIVVDNATDISREVADFVLLKNSFKIIPEAIAEGRGLFRKIQNITAYLLSTSFSEVTLIGLSILIGLPLPLIPVQILFLNLITDGLPDLALAFEQGHDFSKRNKQGIISKKIGILIGFIAVILNSITFGLFYFLYMDNVAIEQLRTIMFLIIGISSLLYVFSFKSINKSIFEIDLFDNKFLLISVGISMILTIGIPYTPILNTAMELVPLSINAVFFIGLYAFIQLFFIEIVKFILNKIFI